MTQAQGRYPAIAIDTAEGWQAEPLTPPSRLYGANGLRTGADGRIYIAQVSGSQISALDIATGAIEVISPLGGAIVGPDDIAFGANGDIYATEVLDGRVSVRAADGSTRVLRGDLPAANGITVHQGRLFVGECRPDGRLMELDLDCGAPRIIAEGVPMPNAMEVGPDGKLYFPVMGANEIWRVDPAGGTPEKVTGDLGVPVALKFDGDGQIICPQTVSGDVWRVDPRNGDKSLLAALRPGLDNLTFVDGRLFVSHLTDGEITEIKADGSTREAMAGGMNGPFGVAVGSDGLPYVSDGNTFYALLPGGERRRLGSLFQPGYPGNLRGLAPEADRSFVVTTTNGQIARYRPWTSESEVLAEGFDQLLGVAIGKDGLIAAAEFGTGKVVGLQGKTAETLASGLSEPVAVAFTGAGDCLVSEAGAGRVVRIAGGRTETVVDGLRKPHGIAVVGSTLYIVDVGAQALVAFDLDRGTRTIIASQLPVGAAPGVEPKLLRAFPPFSGPLRPFAGLAAGSDGSLIVSADADGSVVRLRRG
jgi:sugar lactone lactonase YvrE